MTNEQLKKANELRSTIIAISNTLKVLEINNNKVTLEITNNEGYMPCRLQLTNIDFSSVREAIKQELKLILGKFTDEFENL